MENVNEKYETTIYFSFYTLYCVIFMFPDKWENFGNRECYENERVERESGY